MGLANYTPTSYKDIAPSDTLGLLPELTTAAAPTQAITMDAVTEEFPLHALKQYDQLQQNVIDGDTIKGDQFGLAANVRLKGYNAPEMADKKYDDQTYIDSALAGTTTPEQALGLEAKRDLINNTFTMQKVAGLAEAKDRKLLMLTEGYDKGGQRLLGGIYGTKDGKITDDISSRMLAEGDSNVWFEKNDPQVYEKSKLEKQLIDQALSKAQNSNDSNDWARYENMIQRSGLSKGEKDVYLNPDFLIAKPVANAVIGAGELTSKAGNLAIELVGNPRGVVQAAYESGIAEIEADPAAEGYIFDKRTISKDEILKSDILDAAQKFTKAPDSKDIEKAFAPIREQLNQTFNTTIFSELRPAETASVAKAVHDWENGREGAGAIGIAKAVFNGLVNEENAAMLIPGAGMSLLVLGKAKEFEDSGASKEKALAYGAMYTVLNKIGLNASLGQVKNLANLAAGRFATNAGLELLTENAQSLLELDAAGKIKSLKDVETSLRHTTLETAPSAIFGGTTGLVRDVVDGKDLKGKAAAKIQESIAKIREDKELEVPTAKLATDDISKLEEEVANVAGADFKNRLAASLTQAIQSGDEEAATRLTAVAKAYKEQIAATTQAATREDGTLSVKTLGSNPAALQAYFDSIAEAKDETVREELISKLINDKDLRDPEQYNMSEEQLKEYADILRGSAAVANELNGIAATNSMIVDTGFATPAGVYEGMIEVFTKASNGDKGALAQANRFAGLQAQKQEALAAGVADAQEQAMSDVEAMARETKLSSDTVLQALAYLGNRTIKNNGANIKDETPFIKSAVAFMNARGAKIDTSANIIEQGKQAKAQYKGSALDKDLGKAYKFKYANPMGRNEGNYELNKFEVISDLQQAKMTEGTLVPTGISKLQAAVQAETNTINSAIEKVQGHQAKLNEILTALTTRKEAPVAEVKEETKKEVEEAVAKPKGRNIVSEIASEAQAEQDTDKRTKTAATITKSAKDVNAEKDSADTDRQNKVDAEVVVDKTEEKTVSPTTRGKLTYTVKGVDTSKLSAFGKKMLDKLTTEGTASNAKRITRFKEKYNRELSGKIAENSYLTEEAQAEAVKQAKEAISKISKQKKADAKEEARISIVDMATRGVDKLLGDAVTMRRILAVQKKMKQMYNKAQANYNEMTKAVGDNPTAKQKKTLSDLLTDVRTYKAAVKAVAQRKKELSSAAAVKKNVLEGIKKSTTLAEGQKVLKPKITEIVKTLETTEEPLANFEAMTLFDGNTKLLDKILEAIPRPYSEDGKDTNDKTKQISYAIPLLFKEVKGKQVVRENTAVALYMATMEVLDDASTGQLSLDKEALREMYNLDDSATDAQVEALVNIGLPAKFLAFKIGETTMRLLGLVPNKEAADYKELNTHLRGSLGLYGLRLAEDMKLATSTRQDGNDKFTNLTLAALLGNTAEEIDQIKETYGSVPIYMVAQKADGSTGVTAAKNYDEANAYVGRSGDNRSDVKFSASSPKKFDGKIRRNEMTEASGELVEAQKTFSAQAWSMKGVNGNHKAMAEMFAMGKDAVKRAMGYRTNEQLKETVSAERYDAEVSKNKGIARAVDSLFDIYEKLQSGEEANKMWFDWFIAKSYRLMVDSAGLNPQLDKLHRHLMYTAQAESTVTKDKKSQLLFKIGVAQALGYGTDKEANADSAKYAEQFLTKDGAKALREAWDKHKQEIVDGKISDGTIAVKIGDKTEVVSAKVLSHFLDGLEAIELYVAADGKEFTTTLLVEADGVTNGFALKILQMLTALDGRFGTSTSPTAAEWLGKVGFSIEGISKIGIQKEEFSQLINKRVDSYKTLGSALDSRSIESAILEIDQDEDADIKIVQMARPDSVAKEVLLDDSKTVINALGPLKDAKGQVTKWARELFKPPFMTFGYGAGWNKIKKELAEMIMEKLVVQIERTTTFDSSNAEHVNTLAFARMLLQDDEISWQDARDVLMATKWDNIAYGDTNAKKYLMALIQASYGNAVKTEMLRNFSELEETNKAIRTAMSAMHRIWEVKLTEKLTVLADAGEVTEDALVKIYDELLVDFPMIEDAFGNRDNGIALFKTEIQKQFKNELGSGSKYGNIQIAAITKEDKTRSVQKLVQAYVEAATAAVVIPIHALDAAIMSQVAKHYGVLEIHDAIVTGLATAEEVVKLYNKTFFEMSLRWNFAESVYNSVTAAIGIHPTEMQKVLAADEKLAKTLAPALARLSDIVVRSKKARAQLLVSDVKVEQMVLTANSAYMHEGKRLMAVTNKKLKALGLELLEKGCK